MQTAGFVCLYVCFRSADRNALLSQSGNPIAETPRVYSTTMGLYFGTRAFMIIQPIR